MKRAVLFGIAALASCSFKPTATCPSVEALAHRDAAADARSAFTRRDPHFLMLGGFAGVVPGVRDPGSYPTRMIEDTSDTTSEPCRQQRSTAERYAAKFNTAMVQSIEGYQKTCKDLGGQWVQHPGYCFGGEPDNR